MTDWSWRAGCAGAALLLVSSTACTGTGKAGGQETKNQPTTSAAPLAPPATARQYIVGIDISGSRTATQLDEARRLLTGVIGRITNGDRLVLVETYQAGTDAARQWQDSVPAPHFANRMTGADRRNREDFQAIAQATAMTFFDPARAKQIKSTDIFGTLARAGDYARAASGRRTTLLILSDMIQSTPEVNMERSTGIPNQRWIDGLKAQGRLPDLRGVCVFVVGADVTSARGAAIRNFWAHYLDASGAQFNLGRYRNMVPDAGEVRCE